MLQRTPNPFKDLKRPEVSTSMLLGIFSHYKDPRGHVHDLVKKGVVTSVKQGIYLLHRDILPCPYSKLLLANMIFGPSYISLESAMSLYGFIPEKVESITSVCLSNSRSFETAVGVFHYSHVKNEIYPHGITLGDIDEHASYLLATPEKALLDFIYLREKKGTYQKAKDYFDYLHDSYRFDMSTIKKTISLSKIRKLSTLYPGKHLLWLVEELGRRIKK
ncbi:MAG: hypothetical protein WCG27_03135 [Pseudomonadota bacterium]